MALNPSLLPEIGPDGLPREAPVIAYTEKVIEEEQLQLKKYIEENYSKIRDVEREFANLTLELKLTAGPKKAALELMRKKIEMSTERIRAAKLKEEQARKVWEEASKAIKDEEAIKQKLCDDLNRLVQESSNAQFSRLEELKRRLEVLNPSKAPISDLPDLKSVEPAKSSNKALGASASSRTSVQAGQVMGGNAACQVNAPVENDHHPWPSVEGEGRGKKKILNPGRGKGTGIVLKARGSPGSGWTGSGFDVDGRN